MADQGLGKGGELFVWWVRSVSRAGRQVRGRRFLGICWKTMCIWLKYCTVLLETGGRVNYVMWVFGGFFATIKKKVGGTNSAA